MRCAPKLVPQWCWAYIELYEQWKLGTLAVAGGTLDQPAKIADAMRIIAHTIADLQRAKEEAPQPGGVAVGGKPHGGRSKVPGAWGAANAPAPSTGPLGPRR